MTLMEEMIAWASLRKQISIPVSACVCAWRLLRDLTVLGQLLFPTDRDYCVWVYIHITVRTYLCFVLDRRSEEN